MHVVDDETACGPMCQHPQCWQSHRRNERGIPRRTRRPPTPDSDEEGLPTLKVCNLFGGEDDDNEMLLLSNRSKFQYTNLSNFQKKPGIRPPQTQTTSLSLDPRTSHSAPPSMSPLPKKIRHVEVQEVFDVEDLKATWRDTFVSKSYYVWVPRAKKSFKPDILLNPMQNVPVHAMLKAPKPIFVQDVTESMVPMEVVTQREKRGKNQRNRSRRSPTGGQPYLSPRPIKVVPKSDIELLLELLDLPQNILDKLPEANEEAEETSKEKLREMLLKLASHLPQDSTSLSVATSDILLQKRMILLDGKEKLLQKQADINVEKDIPRDILEKLTSVNAAKEYKATSTTGSETVKHEAQGFYRQPLPSIERQTNLSQMTSHRARIPSVSLGLPEIPSGQSLTRTFTYDKKLKVDFSIGPLETPEGSRLETPLSENAITVNMPSVCDYEAGSVSPEVGTTPRHLSEVGTSTPTLRERNKSLPAPLQTLSMHTVTPGYSTHVSDTPTTTPATRTIPWLAQASSGALISEDQGDGTPWLQTSPDAVLRHSVQVPVGDVNDTFGPPTQSSKTPDAGTVGLHKIDTCPRMQMQTPKLLPEMPKNQPQTPGTRHLETLSKQSKRSVHFAPDVAIAKSNSIGSRSRSRSPSPRFIQRLHSPKMPSRDLKVLSIESESSKQHIPRVHHKNKLSRTSNSPTPPSIPKPVTASSSIMVFGSRTLNTANSIKPLSVSSYRTDNSPEPEPWPQVNEDEFDLVTPMPLVKTPATAVSKEIVSSRLANIDVKSERSNLSSVTPKSESRESARDSARSELAKILLQEQNMVLENSPGPPPPSPEIAGSKKFFVQGGSMNHAVNVGEPAPRKSMPLDLSKDVLEMPLIVDSDVDDDQLTISAAPPSRLDSGLATPIVVPSNVQKKGSDAANEVDEEFGSLRIIDKELTQQSSHQLEHEDSQRNLEKFMEDSVPRDVVNSELKQEFENLN